MRERTLPDTFACRAARVGDAEAIATVYLRSRKELVACAPLAHSDAEVREWIHRRLIPAGRTTVALVGGEAVGLLAVSIDAAASSRNPSWMFIDLPPRRARGGPGRGHVQG